MPKTIIKEDGKIIGLHFWDIAGEERFGSMTRLYYKDSHADFVFFDPTRINTLEGSKKWKLDFDSKILLPDGSPIPCLLFSTKSDLEANYSEEMKKIDFEEYWKILTKIWSYDEELMNSTLNQMIDILLENDKLFNSKLKEDDEAIFEEKDKIIVDEEGSSFFQKAFQMVNSYFIDPDVTFSISNECCTDILNEKNTIKRNQKIFKCYDCEKNSICESCIIKCHKEHKTEYSSIGYIYCQCVR